jgi:5,10-methylenetetrahydromethanopterin reductase
MACGFASLNQLAPGRIDFGVGTGNTARSLMGVGALRLAEVQQCLHVVRGLLAGDVVEYEFEGAPRKITFMHPVSGLVNTHDPIRYHMSAMGPRSRKITAELGVGWINFLTGMPAALADAADFSAKWQAAGRDLQTCYMTGFSLGCVLADGEPYDSPRAKAQAGPHAAMVLQHLINMGDQIDLGVHRSEELNALATRYQQIYDAYEPRDARYMRLYRTHLVALLPEEADFITGDLIRQITLTGTVPDLREHIRALRDAGYRQLTIQLVPGQEDALDDWARVLEGV